MYATCKILCKMLYTQISRHCTNKSPHLSHNILYIKTHLSGKFAYYWCFMNKVFLKCLYIYSYIITHEHLYIYVGTLELFFGTSYREESLIVPLQFLFFRQFMQWSPFLPHSRSFAFSVYVLASPRQDEMPRNRQRTISWYNMTLKK